MGLNLWGVPKGNDDLLNPLGPTGKNPNSESPKLEVEFEKGSHPIVFPSPQVGSLAAPTYKLPLLLLLFLLLHMLLLLPPLLFLPLLMLLLSRRYENLLSSCQSWIGRVPRMPGWSSFFYYIGGSSSFSVKKQIRKFTYWVFHQIDFLNFDCYEMYYEISFNTF